MLKRHHRFLFLIPFVLVLIPFLVWPALLGFLASFTNYEPFQRITLRLVGLRNYTAILADVDFREAIRNIIVFTVVTVTVELVLGVAVAYALRRPFQGRGLVRLALLLPWLVSPIANGVMWHFLFNMENGIVNYWPALLGLSPLPSPLGSGLALSTAMAVDIWRKMPLVSFLVLPGLLGIPTAQWDQADVEGLSLLGRVRHIVFPRLRALILTIAMLLMGDALGTSDSLLILTGGGPASQTMTPGLYSYQQALSGFDWKAGATSAWLIAASVLLVGLCYLFLTRQEVY